ncbi:MAG: fasciclin domain-containing protein [Vampirovibrionales bacterium]
MNFSLKAFVATLGILAVVAVALPQAWANTGAKHSPATHASPAPTANIVQTAVKAGQFKTLVAALQAADLDETLAGKGPFTVFAPTDAAFAKLPAGTVESLLKPENKAQLTKVLTYHVVAGRYCSGSVVKQGTLKTLEGKTLKATINKKGVFINNAKVATLDVRTSNGTIHIVDTVLLP